MGWFSINGQNIDLPLWHNRFSRCWGVFWSLVEHLSRTKGCPGGISHHSVPPSWAKMCVIMPWFTGNGQIINWCSSRCWFSRFRRILWSMIQHIPWIDWYSGGASQDCMRKCVFMVWSSKMVRTLNCLHGETIFSRCWWTFWSLIEHLTHVERYQELVSQHCVPLQLDQKVCIHGLIQYKWLEHWLAFIAKWFSRCWGAFW